MEIERVLSGDLNKNIEQCVTLLQDVERKTHNLKAELAQSLVQIQASRGVVSPANILGYAPATAQVPYAAVQPMVPTAVSGIQALPSGIPGQSFSPYPTTVLAPATPFVGTIAPQALPQAFSPWTQQNLATLPWQNFLAQSYLPPAYVGQGYLQHNFAPQSVVPFPTIGTFAPFGVSPVASMQHYGYI